MKKSVVAALLLVPAIAFADPSPFGLEIGKATIKDVKSKYSVKSAGTNKYSQGEMYDLDVSKISFEDLQSARAIFGTDGRLLAILCTLPKSKFNYLLDSLKGKYKIVNSNIPFVGDKSANFVNGGTEISLNAPHLSFEMDMNYVHKDLQRAYNEQINKDQQQKKKQEASQL